ncbi:His Kinase A domain containing protein [Mortierella sp. NVP85]|nr:His Kinase A domain containing protein [Mortierella sp. NVP85]
MGVAGCVITLVDHFQVSIKAQHPPNFGESPREQSFCAHTILRPSDDPMIVLDTKADWRFRNLPGVASAPGVRFYAGAPLTTLEGLNIGALCLVDFEPRSSFTEKERTLLVDFAAVVMREMELWNDQVQLCTRNRMMRDVTRWVRGRLDTSTTETLSDSDPPTRDFRHGESNVLNLSQQPLPTPSDVSVSSSGLDMGPGPALISPPLEPVFPTPSGSPKLMSCAFAPTTTAASQTALGSTSPSTEEPPSVGNQLYDTAFPNACITIQATLDVDAVYLVHASANQSVIPPTGSSVVWNYLDAAGRRKGSVGVVKGGQVFSDRPSSALTYLASSRKDPKIFTRPIYDEKYQHTKRKGSCWVCTDEGCRPHQLGRELLGATEPDWERDLPIIKEMLGYVREELPDPYNVGGEFPLYTYSEGQEAIENDWFAGSPDLYPKHPRSRKLLCHTFQGTLPALRAGANTPYQSASIVPVLGPSSNTSDEEPWAYFVILSSSRNKQISFHERIYLKNFGSCLVTEVQRRRIEAADKAKGVFIKSISHELRTPLHIILGILELLCANPEEPLSETQRAMVVTAENSGNLLNDTINNIIDLAKLDPDNTTECVKRQGDGSSAPLPVTDGSVMEEMDIRELCQKVAEQMAKACTDKNVVVIPSWTKPSLTSLSSSVSATAAAGASAANFGSIQSTNGYTSSSESLSSFSARRLRNERKAILELMVALDEPERNPDQDTAWNFVFDVTSMTRILKQLVENAIKFTTTGFVELSAVPLTNSPLPMKPPHPDAQAILFTVRDTGKGISADFVQSHLFKRFTQEDPLQTGTGLGMALVKEYIRKLGGWMEVWSEGVEGKGCVVKVLIWARPALNQTKSLKDIAGPWQDASCRFYCGESTVGSERLFKILGERMMGQQLNMNVERGDEQDVCAEDMLKDLADHSRCDLLVFNDDLGRLKAYLSYWTEYHHKVKAEGIKDPKIPTPLLILVAPPHVKDVQPLIDEYLETQIDNSSIERPASIVIMTKPIGPIKLMQCLRECFTPAFADPGRQTPPPEGSTHVRSGSQKLPPMPLLRSATAPNIPTVALGSRLMSGGGMMKQSMMYPVMTHGEMRPGMVLIPPHSPGGLVIPPRILSSVGISPVSTPEHEHYSSYYGPHFDGHHGILDSFALVHPRPDAGTNGGAHSSDPGGSAGKSLTKPRSQRSIKDYHAQRLRSGKSATTTTTTETSTAEASTSSSSKSSEPVAAQEDGAPEKPLPRVLIVEDNITNRMILRTFLKKRGIEFVEAENGKLGVERFQEEVWRRGGKAGFEFVLMDLQMPVMDGNMATRQIREFECSMMKQAELANSLNNNPWSESAGSTSSGMDPIPEHGEESFAGGYRPSIIFALTGLAGEEDKRLAFECGVDGYLTKPVSLKTLGTLMSNCLPENMEGLTLFNPVETTVQA